jgi:hypothetical protein
VLEAALAGRQSSGAVVPLARVDAVEAITESRQKV